MSREQELLATIASLHQQNLELAAQCQLKDKHTEIMDILHIGVVIHRADSSIAYSNPAAASILGLSGEQMQKKIVPDSQWYFFQPDGTRLPLDDYPANRVINNRTAIIDMVIGINRPDLNKVVWVLVNGNPIIADDALQEVVVTFVDITREKYFQKQLEEKNRKLEELVRTDPLTGVANRRHLMEHLENEIRRTSRYGHKLAICMLDIDHFKSVNDTYGHKAGDEVLQLVASTIQATIREVDLVGRYGGEEFLVVIPDTPLSAAGTLAERIRHSVEQLTIGRKNIQVTISCGLAGYQGEELLAFVDRADTNLYQAKEQGRNQVVY